MTTAAGVALWRVAHAPAVAVNLVDHFAEVCPHRPLALYLDVVAFAFCLVLPFFAFPFCTIVS